MQRISSRTVYKGTIIDVRVDRFRHEDGEEADREIAAHPGAVAIVAYDDETVWLVRQPREPVDEAALLEFRRASSTSRASRISTAQSASWSRRSVAARERVDRAQALLHDPRVADEEITIFLATGLDEVADAEPDPKSGSRSSSWPLPISTRRSTQCVDAKTLDRAALVPRLASGGPRCTGKDAAAA